mmetsp:Transcript_9849/g.24247  ORF Transcript_9849/g.24247 Transcript_9849/m.24247 type:complete len:330 (+) Transcript_9849:1811-2800(+)
MIRPQNTRCNGDSPRDIPSSSHHPISPFFTLRRLRRFFLPPECPSSGCLSGLPLPFPRLLRLGVDAVFDAFRFEDLLRVFRGPLVLSSDSSPPPSSASASSSFPLSLSTSSSAISSSSLSPISSSITKSGSFSESSLPSKLSDPSSSPRLVLLGLMIGFGVLGLLLAGFDAGETCFEVRESDTVVLPLPPLFRRLRRRADCFGDSSDGFCPSTVSAALSFDALFVLERVRRLAVAETFGFFSRGSSSNSSADVSDEKVTPFPFVLDLVCLGSALGLGACSLWRLEVSCLVLRVEREPLPPVLLLFPGDRAASSIVTFLEPFFLVRLDLR